MTNYGSKAMRNRLLAGSLLASACFGLTFTGPAYAQATSPTDQETEQEQVLVVTGSRINNPNLVQATQIQVVSEEEILLQQANTVEELLRQLPGAVPNIGPAVNNGTNGNAEFDLRGLGSNRNLILIGGQRVVPAGLTSAVNTDIIPLALVQRADVVTGGASSTYGADAISGVVNFILKDDFVGLELQTSYRFTQRVDGETFRADLLWGTNFDNDRGNVAVSLGYQDRNATLQGERPFGQVGCHPARAALRVRALPSPETSTFHFQPAWRKPNAVSSIQRREQLASLYRPLISTPSIIIRRLWNDSIFSPRQIIG